MRKTRRELPDRHSDIRAGACTLRLPYALVAQMRTDLERAHASALERVGFLTVGTGAGDRGEPILVGAEYTAVADDAYVPGRGAATRIGGEAIRNALELALRSQRGIFHVHLHDHDGETDFSPTDRREQPRLVESLRAIAPDKVHGMLVLSRTSATAWVWLPGNTQPERPRRLSIVGYPITVCTPGIASHQHEDTASASDDEIFERQSFLGLDSLRRFRSTRVGIVGYGGGGSHIGQQLAHLGFASLRVIDADHVDASNHNRLVGGAFADISAETAKCMIAKRVVTAINPKADIQTFGQRWQEIPHVLRSCDVVVGCVDTFAGRRELETLARRYAIPYIDIGMDVHSVEGELPRMAGQLFLSMPGKPCMSCVGILNEESLVREAALYGATGGRPQVIWPNGILASSAVGALVDLITGWTGQTDRQVYLSYDGNLGTLSPHVRLRYLANTPCTHYPLANAGDPVFLRP